MSEANKMQVGGDHYHQSGQKLQHWDLSIHYQWDPFQYQITKYVMRWKDKHSTFEKKLEDLRKAAHFLQKYIENAHLYAPDVKQGDAAPLPWPPHTEPSDPLDDSDLSAAWSVEGFYGDMTQHYRCKRCGLYERAKSIHDAAARHGDCAWHGYVNQD